MDFERSLRAGLLVNRAAAQSGLHTRSDMVISGLPGEDRTHLALWLEIGLSWLYRIAGLGILKPISEVDTIRLWSQWSW
jgi:hypothetical protein